MRRLSAPFLVPTILLACGGSTSHDGNAGVGASGGASGFGASGGTSAGGGAAAAGAGAAGSSGAGGSAGTTAENETAAHIAVVCGTLSGTKCSVSVCLQDFVLSEYKVKLYGCQGELSAYLTCALQHPPVCKEIPESHMIEPSPACATQAKTLKACLPYCYAAATPTSCTMQCKGKVSWQVDCAPNGQFVHCACTKGPNVGAEADFGATCGGLDFGALVEPFCVAGSGLPPSE